MTEEPPPSQDTSARRGRFLPVARTQAFTLIVGIIIMGLTLFGNNWIIQAKSVFATLERVNAVYESLDQASLVLLYDLCDQNEEAITPMELARVVSISNTIQRHDSLLEQAYDNAIKLINRLDWRMTLPSFSMTETAEFETKGQIDWSKVPNTMPSAGPEPEGTETTGPPKAPQVKMTQDGDTGASPLARTEREIICDALMSDPSDLMLNFRVWRESLKGFSKELQILRSEQMFTGRGPGWNEVLEQKLQAKMTLVTHWWLPVLNGALGAIIFCLTRMLRDRATAPKLGEVLLRMVFGGFAGVVVSTLLLPSGVALGPYTGSAPAISLLAFIFGFSLDSFIMVLERLNRLVVDSTRHKSPDE
jgi:hypothetical protein